MNDQNAPKVEQPKADEQKPQQAQPQEQPQAEPTKAKVNTVIKPVLNLTDCQAVDDADTETLVKHPERFYNLMNLIYRFTWDKGKILDVMESKDGFIVKPMSKFKFDKPKAN